MRITGSIEVRRKLRVTALTGAVVLLTSMVALSPPSVGEAQAATRPAAIVRVMAQEILDSGRLSYLGDHKGGHAYHTLHAYADGDVYHYNGLACQMDARLVNGLHYLTVRLKYRVTINDSQRYCNGRYRQFGSGTSSYHYKYGGGGAIDIGVFTPPSGTTVYPGASPVNANYTSVEIALNRNFLVGAGGYALPKSARSVWAIEHRGCRTGQWHNYFGNDGFTESPDYTPCHHYHIETQSPQRTYAGPGVTKVLDAEAVTLADLDGGRIVYPGDEPPLPAFGPDDDVDRREMATYLYRIAGAPKVDVGTNTYTDVSSSDTHFRAMRWMLEDRISVLSGGTVFKPTTAVSRQAFAAFLYRLDGTSYRGPSTSPFSDVPTSHQFYDEITWLRAAGLTSGYADDTFRPTERLSRESTAVMLYRYMGRPAVELPRSSPYRDVSASSWTYEPVLWMTQGHVSVDRFSDVPMTNAFYSEIEWMADSKITTGYGDGTYRPATALDRASLAVFLYRLAGSPDYTPPSQSPFRDVDAQDRFYKQIAWIASEDITAGYGDGTFRPDEAVNRQTIAAYLYRAAGRPAYTPPASSPFPDVPTNHTFYKAISWMHDEGITDGYGDGTFRPSADVTRQTAAAFLYRYAH